MGKNTKIGKPSRFELVERRPLCVRPNDQSTDPGGVPIPRSRRWGPPSPVGDRRNYLDSSSSPVTPPGRDPVSRSSLHVEGGAGSVVLRRPMS